MVRSVARSALCCGSLILLLLASAGCIFGGSASGDESEDEFGLMEFSDPEPTPIVAAEVELSLGIDSLVLEELGYLYRRQVMLEQLSQTNRDLLLVMEMDQGRDPEPAGLDWVIEVHETVAESRRISDLALSMPVPDYQREKHADLYVGELRAIQVMSYGSARLLEAATVIGPGGRNVDLLGASEYGRFQGLMREAGYFLNRSTGLFESETETIGAIVGRVQIR